MPSDNIENDNSPIIDNQKLDQLEAEMEKWEKAIDKNDDKAGADAEKNIKSLLLDPIDKAADLLDDTASILYNIN